PPLPSRAMTAISPPSPAHAAAARASPSGKAPVFGTGIRRFESCRPSQSARHFAFEPAESLLGGRPAAGSIPICPREPLGCAESFGLRGLAGPLGGASKEKSL